MSIFNELLPKINAISDDFIKNFNNDLQAAFDCFDKFEEEFHNGRRKAREKASKDKNPMTTLQSIHEDEDESTKLSETESTKRRSSTKSTTDLTTGRSSSESNTDKPRRASKKRSKHEVDDMLSPEQDKRQKRNASVKAQSIISKQVNVNLSAKLRREDTEKSSRGRRRKEDDKENSEPLLNIQIKQEKISLLPEPMDAESLPLETEILVKKEVDDLAMPPPAAPVPRPRKGAAKEKPDDSSEENSSAKKRSTRNRKQTNDSVAPVPSARSTRASSRSTRQLDAEEVPPPEPRPKRTRAKKKASEAPEPEKAAATQESAPASPAEKPRPKRTRRGQKAAEKQEEKPEEKPKEVAPPTISPKEERVSNNEISSPILQKEIPKKGKKDPIVEITRLNLDEIDAETMKVGNIGDMDKTVVIPNGVYNHAPVTPKNVRNMNETVVIEAATRETMVLDKPQNAIMDATVVLDKDPKAVNITDDNSLLTDDSDAADMHTPPKQVPPQIQPTSAVKEKVQQFEELASRVTRTKTRAMAKKQEEQPETHTPPDKIVKPVLSAETLTKMNSMIFNGKPPQISSSATKPRANIVTSTKSMIPSSASKLSVTRAREADELRREREDARKKKEALLEAKRELQKKKREEKMAAAAAAREAAEKERRLALEAAARERQEKQAHADLGKLERLKEVERKKQELARKVAETEERRRAEEHARQQRLAEEQRRADDARRKQLEEAAAMKKEAAIMAKEIEKRQKEYIEKQKMKRMEDKSHTPLKSGTPSGWHGSALSPVYMADGFQYLNSDEDEEPVDRPIPEWSTSKARKAQLLTQSLVQASHVDRLFSVRVHCPDLRDIFPNIERARLKRTSSAVWRTPPRLPALAE
uniref:Inner centromere protein ARK-binding domain-containing protein n=2 Tax=Heliothis virescens TaxID=7102 RepID=A0A2A4JCH6_HELVI